MAFLSGSDRHFGLHPALEEPKRLLQTTQACLSCMHYILDFPPLLWLALLMLKDMQLALLQLDERANLAAPRGHRTLPLLACISEH